MIAVLHNGTTIQVTPQTSLTGKRFKFLVLTKEDCLSADIPELSEMLRCHVTGTTEETRQFLHRYTLGKHLRHQVSRLLAMVHV